MKNYLTKHKLNIGAIIIAILIIAASFYIRQIETKVSNVELKDANNTVENTVDIEQTQQSDEQPKNKRMYLTDDQLDSAENISGHSTFPFYRFEGKVFYSNMEILNVDADSFEHIQGGYAKDNNNIYYMSTKIKTADVNSFEVIEYPYAKDLNNIYYVEHVIEGADSNTFEIIDRERGYAKDMNNVFAAENIFPDLDPNTVVFSGDTIVKDKNGVYILYYNTYLSKVDGADGDSFNKTNVCSSVEKSRGYYYIDDNSVYSEYTKIEYIDRDSFEFLESAYGFGPYSSSYSKDKNNVYFGCGGILENADRNTFKVIGLSYAVDQNNAWYYGKIINEVDVESFEFIGEHYAKDKDYVYFSERVVEGADPDTFEMVIKYKEDESNSRILDVYGKDKNNVYYFGKILENVNPEKCIDESPDSCNPEDVASPNFSIG